jgi:hypothetical protein
MAKGNWSHGQSRVSDPHIKKAYQAWANMRQRCVNPKTQYFHRYGGRGIKVHPAWDVFTVFLQDVGLPPTFDHLLDRMNNDGDYEPGNVKWSTISESNSNKGNPGPTPVLRSKYLDEVKKLSSEGLSTRKIAAQLGLGKSYVHRLVHES